MQAVLADRPQSGLLGQAPVEHVAAPRVELAAGRQVDQAGRRARDRPQPVTRGGAARYRLEQSLGVRVMRRVEHVPLGRLLRRPSRVHDHDVVRDVRHHAEVVRDHDQRGVRLLLQPQQQVDDLGLHGRVERRGRLVRDDHPRRERQRHGDHRPLPHAAGELVRVVVHPPVRARNAHPAQEFHGPFVRLFLGDRLVMGPDHLGDLPADLVQRMQAGQRVLEDHRDARTADVPHLVLAERQQVGPVEQGATRYVGARGKPEQRLRQHRLAASRLADDAERPARLHAERHAAHRPDNTVSGRETDGQVRYLKQGQSIPPAGSSAATMRFAADTASVA